MLPGLNQPKAPPYPKNYGDIGVKKTYIFLSGWLRWEPCWESGGLSSRWAGSLVTQWNPVLLSFVQIASTIPIVRCFFVLCGVCNTSQFSTLLPLMNMLLVFSPPTSSLIKMLGETGPITNPWNTLLNASSHPWQHNHLSCPFVYNPFHCF